MGRGGRREERSGNRREEGGAGTGGTRKTGGAGQERAGRGGASGSAIQAGRKFSPSAPIIEYQFDEDHASSHCMAQLLGFTPAPILALFTEIEDDGSPLGLLKYKKRGY